MKKSLSILFILSIMSCSSQSDNIDLNKIKSDLAGKNSKNWGKKSDCWNFGPETKYLDIRINNKNRLNNEIYVDTKMILEYPGYDGKVFLHSMIIYDNQENFKRAIILNCFRNQEDTKLLPEIRANNEEMKFIGRWKTDYDSTILTINKYFEDYLTVVALSPTINGQHKGYLKNGSINVMSYGVGLGTIIYNNENNSMRFAGMNFTKIE